MKELRGQLVKPRWAGLALGPPSARAGRGRGDRDQSGLLQLRPQRGGDRMLDQRHVLLHLGEGAGARNHRHDGGMREDELEGRRPERHVVALAHGGDARALSSISGAAAR